MDKIYNAASIAIHAGGRFLLIERAREPYRGFWTLPGGRLEPGESPDDCVKREMAEELGIRVEPEFVTSMPVDTGGAIFRLAVYTGTYDGSPITPNDEISGWGWHSSTDATGLQTTPGLIDILNQVSRSFTRD